jgi:hypothetical protein
LSSTTSIFLVALAIQTGKSTRSASLAEPLTYAIRLTQGSSDCGHPDPILGVEWL